jgi:hypothetical protein
VPVSGRVGLGALSLDEGGALLVARAVRATDPGGEVTVTGDDPSLGVHLRGWARAHGCSVRESDGSWTLRVEQSTDRRRGAERAGSIDAAGVVDHPPARWGLAPRGALVEAGTPEMAWPLHDKDAAWADDAGRLYQQAAAAQWDPARAIEWTPPSLHEDAEDAVVQVMTFLIENETAALVVPARFAARVHPHFREVMQLLAIQAADEARHVEVFTRRATLVRGELGLSTAGGQQSLATILDEADFELSSFLLSVLGEGSFLDLLWFLRDRAPDPVTRSVARLSAQDEARHVAFGLAHLQRHAERDPSLRQRLAVAMRRRHDALRQTAGLNEEVFDALVLLAAGSWEPDDVREGHAQVTRLVARMHEGRVGRLVRLGFDLADARELSALHTRNFM